MSLFVEERGRSGPALVLLHALPHDLTLWTYQSARFSASFRTIAIDLPGHGRSPSLPEGGSMADVAALCWDAVDDAAPGETVALLGVSVGAITAKHMAASRPDRVRALVLTGGGYHEGRKGIAARHVPAYRADGAAYKRRHLAANFSAAFRDTPLARYLVDLVLARRDPADVGGTIALLEALDAPDPAGLHERILVPTLVVAGGEDRSLDAQRELARHIAGAELRVIDGAGHCCNQERPWEYDRAVLDFLHRHASPGFDSASRNRS